MGDQLSTLHQFHNLKSRILHCLQNKLYIHTIPVYTEDFVRILRINSPIADAWNLINKSSYRLYAATTIDIGFKFQGLHALFFLQK